MEIFRAGNERIPIACGAGAKRYRSRPGSACAPWHPWEDDCADRRTGGKDRGASGDDTEGNAGEGAGAQGCPYVHSEESGRDERYSRK